MTLEQFQKDLAGFNAWANNRMVQWLQSQPAELLEQEMASSFPSIRLTLSHILDAESVWLDRLQGIAPDYASYEDYKGSIELIFNTLLATSERFRDYVHGLQLTDLEVVCDFHKMDGTPDRRPRFEMIHHCLNHSTYHRGQLVTMARNMGILNPPNTDYMGYVRSKGVNH